jgi:peptidoglycan/LPS O-acetylase OafA/YrhL
LQLNAMTGLMGMSLFFCLSGFLITRILFKTPDVTIFLVRRFARIYPLLVLYALIVAVMIFDRWDTFFGIILFYKNYSDALSVPATGHLWSISVEIHFYLAIALSVFIFGRKGFWLVPVAAAVVLALRMEAGAYSNIRTHLRVDEILSGSLLALLWLHQDHALAGRICRGLGLSFWPAVILWLLSSHQIGGALNYMRPFLAMAVVGSILFMPEGRVRRLCRTRVLAYVAGISYALYIWHPLTMLGGMNEGARWSVYAFKRPVSFAVTFFLAHVSTRTIERYFINRAKGMSERFPAP